MSIRILLRQWTSACPQCLDDRAHVGASDASVDLVDLDDALSKLEELDPRAAKIVHLRFFGGLTVAETAKVLVVSTRTVEKDWRRSRAWLTVELEQIYQYGDL